MTTTDATSIQLSGESRLRFSLTAMGRLLTALLVVDGLFILAHLLHTRTGWLTADSFGLDAERGLAELWQYVKFAGVIGLLALLFVRQRTPLLLHWLLFFLYLLLDDARQLHENGGYWLAMVLELGEGWGLRPRDWGELLVFALAGLFFLTTLILTYQRSEPSARRFSQSLIFWVLVFVGVAVILDMVQESLRATWVGSWLILAEDGGELLVLSFIVQTVWRKTQAVYQWPQTQIQARVRVVAAAISLFIVFILLFAGVQYATPGLIGNDGYYHAKMGLLVRQEGLTPTPPQLPLTILNPAEFYNHHLLYHLYLSLFALVDPAVDGGLALTESIKLASLLLPALVFVSIWWLLRQQGVSWPALWALVLLALSEPFLYRLSMTRAQSASLLLLVWALHCLLRGQYRWLMPLGFVYVWLYNGFPLLWLMVGAYLLATALTERRLIGSPLVYATVGIVAGLVINPYFPENVTFIIRHLGPKVGELAVPVGNEWYPYDTWQLVEHSGWALLAFFGAMLVMGRQGQRLDKRTVLLFLLAAAFGLMLLKSRRFIEYFPAFVLIFTAFSLTPLLEAWWQKRPSARLWFPVALGVLLLLPLNQTLAGARLLVEDSPSAQKYAAASLWLKAYSSPGSHVFQLDWDDFTRLFFYDSDKVYTVGLDPTYMSQYDPALYEEWVQITQGQVAMPSQAIRERFDGGYVFTDLAHEEFLRVAAADPGLVELYRDEEAVIFALVAP